MKLREKLQKAWENRSQIAEGFYNAYVSSNEEIKAEKERRITICESNVCGHYDAKGETEKVVLKGQPACAACGCNIPAKPAVMWLHCSLKELGQQPLWEAITTKEQDDEINKVQHQQQFKQPE